MPKTFPYYIGFSVTREMHSQIYQMLSKTNLTLSEFMRDMIRDKWDETLKYK